MRSGESTQPWHRAGEKSCLKTLHKRPAVSRRAEEANAPHVPSSLAPPFGDANTGSVIPVTSENSSVFSLEQDESFVSVNF